VTASKSERLMNLLILLLVSRSYVSKERIRESIEEYRDAPSTEAFEKKFERDKDELRALGIPVEVGYLDKFFEDEQGYRIKRDAFELPEIDLAPDEVAVLGLAARVWQHAGLAATTSDALIKLRAAGYDVDREVLDSVQPTLHVEDPSFDPVLQATLTHTPVRFRYRRPGQTDARERHLQPWGVVTADEKWYVVGLDTDRGEPRMFRLSRIEGAVVRDGRPGSFDVPPGTDVRALTQSLAPASRPVEAVVRVRTGAGQGLRRWAEEVERDVAPGWDRVRLRDRGPDGFVSMLLGFGDAVVVEEPAELRAEIRRRLSALVGAAEVNR
jgi:proteasome accessory factor B